MGNGYNHHQNTNIHQKATFLPLLCSKPTMKDVVVLPKLKNQSISSCNDPLSPKIGCMGQVKRNNNKIIHFPSPNKITIFSSPLPPLKYSKLMRIFSVRNPNPTSNSGFYRRKGESFDGGIRRVAKNSNCSSVNLDEMDPPLPVIKKVVTDNGSRENIDSLWKRRSNGLGLKNLQVQHIQINTNNLPPTSV